MSRAPARRNAAMPSAAEAAANPANAATRITPPASPVMCPESRRCPPPGRRTTPGPAGRYLRSPGSARYGADMSQRSLVVKVTAGKDDPERCNQAFTVAATAAASGVPISLWLTGEAAWFALPDHGGDVALPHAVPVADMLAGVLRAGTVTLCTQCAARRKITEADVLNGVRIAGAGTYLAEILADGAQAVVY